MLTKTQPAAGLNSVGTPASETMPAFNREGLVSLGQYLQEVEYQHTVVTQLTHSYNNQRLAYPYARNLRDILGWSRPFERALVSPRVFELMLNAGILTPQGEGWCSSVRWASLRNLLCVHSAYPTDAEDAVFFGPDTYRFAQLIECHLQNNPVSARNLKRAADIGCGSGAGALLVARACPTAQVLAVDINPKALQLTSVNAELAGAARVEALHSNLLDDTQGNFDLIVANPPYMFDAQQRVYRHGGGELGEGLSKQITAAALDRLAPGGTLLLYTGVAIINGQDPLLTILKGQLHEQACHWSYGEVDPDVFAEELLKPAYARVERIAAVSLTLTKQK